MLKILSILKKKIKKKKKKRLNMLFTDLEVRTINVVHTSFDNNVIHT